jgi:hypothetical protein
VAQATSIQTGVNCKSPQIDSFSNNATKGRTETVLLVCSTVVGFGWYVKRAWLWLFVQWEDQGHPQEGSRRAP